MFKEFKIKRELKKRVNIVYNTKNEKTYIKDEWNNVYYLVTEVEVFFEHLIRIYVGNLKYFWLQKDKYCLEIIYRDMIINYITLKTTLPSIFNEKYFKKDCYNVIKTTKELKNKIDKKINKNKLINEGSIKKGGHNKPPSEERPSPPKGQG